MAKLNFRRTNDHCLPTNKSPEREKMMKSSPLLLKGFTGFCNCWRRRSHCKHQCYFCQTFEIHPAVHDTFLQPLYFISCMLSQAIKSSKMARSCAFPSVGRTTALESRKSGAKSFGIRFKSLFAYFNIHTKRNTMTPSPVRFSVQRSHVSFIQQTLHHLIRFLPLFGHSFSI